MNVKKKQELLKPIGIRFFAQSTVLFALVAGGVAQLGPLQADIQQFVDAVKANRWHLLMLYVVWFAVHLLLEVFRRTLELQRESRRSDPQEPRRRVSKRRTRRLRGKGR